jgi:hypothetical protein
MVSNANQPVRTGWPLETTAIADDEIDCDAASRSSVTRELKLQAKKACVYKGRSPGDWDLRYSRVGSFAVLVGRGVFLDSRIFGLPFGTYRARPACI